MFLVMGTTSLVNYLLQRMYSFGYNIFGKLSTPKNVQFWWVQHLWQIIYPKECTVLKSSCLQSQFQNIQSTVYYISSTSLMLHLKAVILILMLLFF